MLLETRQLLSQNLYIGWCFKDKITFLYNINNISPTGDFFIVNYFYNFCYIINGN